MSKPKLTKMESARLKLLQMFSRSTLEATSKLERPWRADRATLLAHAIANWNEDDVRQVFERLLTKARGECRHGRRTPPHFEE